MNNAMLLKRKTCTAPVGRHTALLNTNRTVFCLNDLDIPDASVFNATRADLIPKP